MAQPQFTPNQILDVARRAQADGQLDYAQQAYRHLVDNYPGTAEAVAAHDALAQRQPQPQSPNDLSALTALAANAGSSAVDGAPAAQSNPPRPTLVSPPPPTPTNTPSLSTGNATPATGARRRPQRQRQLHLEPVVSAEPGDRPLPIPALPPRKYPLGRSLAFLAIVIGTIIVAAGGVTLLLAVAAPNTLVEALRVSSGIGILLGCSLAVHGLLTVLAGLATRAVFNNARALQALAAGDGGRTQRRGGP